MTLLSIVTINLNNKLGLISTLESIFRQRLQNIEIVVVDGGSTDGSIDVIKKYENRICATIINEDTGIYNAMNLGVKRCGGRYVHILNSGDEYVSDSILTKCDFSSESSFICFAVKKHHPKKYVWLPRVIDKESFVDVAHPGLIVKREVYSSVAYREDYKVVSDSLFIFQNVKPGETLIYNDVLVEMEPGGISTRASIGYELEKQKLFWLEGYRRRRRTLLSIMSFLVFIRATFRNSIPKCIK